MAVPDFQSIMIPLLRIASNGDGHNVNDVTEELAQQFGLDEHDKRELLPSGKQ